MTACPKRELSKKQARFPNYFMRSMRISQEKGSTTNNVKTLYDIGVTKDDKENKRVKINYVGYCESYDEWREYDGDEDYFPFARHEEKPTNKTIIK